LADSIFSVKIKTENEYSLLVIAKKVRHKAYNVAFEGECQAVIAYRRPSNRGQRT
jgi:hypothetical protein